MDSIELTKEWLIYRLEALEGQGYIDGKGASITVEEALLQFINDSEIRTLYNRIWMSPHELAVNIT